MISSESRLVKLSSGKKVDVSNFRELMDYDIGKEDKIYHPNLKLEQYFENRFGKDWENVLTAGEMLAKNLNPKNEKGLDVELTFLGRFFKKGPFSEFHYLFKGETYLHSCQDPGGTTRLYSVGKKDSLIKNNELRIFVWNNEEFTP